MFVILSCPPCPGHTPQLLMVGDIWSQKQKVTNIETIPTPVGTKDTSLYLGPVISFHREAEAPWSLYVRKT